MEVPLRQVTESHERVEELMDKVLEHKLNEYESRLALVESEVNLISKDLNELRVKTDSLESQGENLDGEVLKRLVEFTDKLDLIGQEVKSIENNLHQEEKAIARIREHEQDAVRSVKKWEKKAVQNLKRQLSAKKNLDVVLKKLLSGGNRKKLDNAVKTASTSAKVKSAVVNSVLKDKNLRAKLVREIATGTRGELKREHVTSKVARVAEKKVMKTVKTKVRKAAKAAAKKAVKKAVKT